MGPVHISSWTVNKPISPPRITTLAPISDTRLVNIEYPTVPLAHVADTRATKRLLAEHGHRPHASPLLHRNHKPNVSSRLRRHEPLKLLECNRSWWIELQPPILILLLFVSTP